MYSVIPGWILAQKKYIDSNWQKWSKFFRLINSFVSIFPDFENFNVAMYDVNILGSYEALYYFCHIL